MCDHHQAPGWQRRPSRSGRRRSAGAVLGCILTVSVLTSGCAGVRGVCPRDWLNNGFKVGPNYCKPAAAVADEWIDFNHPQVISDQVGVSNAAWWEELNDPVLNSLVQSVYRENLSVRVAGLRVLEARQLRAIAVGNLFPQQQVMTGTYQRNQFSAAGNQFGNFPLPTRVFSLWNTGFTLAWEIDLWGRFRRSIEAADARVDFAVEDYDDVLLLLLSEAARAYVDIRAFEERIRYAEANVETQRGSLGLAQARFRNGAVTELDVRQAEANLGETEALIPALKVGRRQANNRLCNLLGIPPRDLSDDLGAAPIPEIPAQVVVGIPAELIRRRPDVRRAERAVAEQSALIGVAAADLYPAFSIGGTLSWQAARFPDLFSSAANGGNVGPSFNWNILNFGRLINNVRVQESRFQQLAVQYQQVVLDANTEAEDALVGYLELQNTVRSLRDSVLATERSVRLATIQYQEGAIDFDRIFNLQRELVRLQDLLASSEADVVVNLITLYKALGGGWQIRLGAGSSASGAAGGAPSAAAAADGEELEVPLADPMPTPQEFEP